MNLDHDRKRTHRVDLGEYRGSGPPCDLGSWDSIRGRISCTRAKKSESKLLPPFGRETALLAKTIDEDRKANESSTADLSPGLY